LSRSSSCSINILHKAFPKIRRILDLTNWTDIDAIKKFAGEKYEIAVVPQWVMDIMKSYDHHVSQYEVCHSVE